MSLQTRLGQLINAIAADVKNLTAKTSAPNLVGYGQLESHGTYTDFNAITDFGFHYVQGNANGPGVPHSVDQYYCLSLSLGSQYSYAQYVCQIAWPRDLPGVVSTRFREDGNWGAWKTIRGDIIDAGGP